LKYTLYIDESGDFESNRGEWVLSGMLFSESYEKCEKVFSNKFRAMPYDLELRSIKDFHLTKFRREFGHPKAIEMAKKVFNKLDSLPFEYHCLVTINKTKTSLANREKTYRLMLSDLLALCETTIPENEVITNLDLVVATRTIDGELQTNISNITEEIIKLLPVALEVDLATKGMVDLIGKHIKVKMDYANNSWGLVCADFLANLNYHYYRENESDFLKQLSAKGKYSRFESFGRFEIRRANIAERDKDYVLALYRWVILVHKKNDIEQGKESIQRLLTQIFNNRGTTGNIISFEAFIERLWRNHNTINKYRELSQILDMFELELLKYTETNQNKNYDNFLFRLRNLTLIIENHLGNTEKALKVATMQNKVSSSLAMNPEFFTMVLDFQIIEIEIYVNTLNFKKAFELSSKYSTMINNYKEVWQLLVEKDEVEQFHSSRANIKAEMTLLRCNILYIGMPTHTTDNNFIEKFNYIGDLLTNKMDISRFNNYRIMLLLKEKKAKEAVNYYINLYENNNFSLSIFDFLWFLKAVNDAILVNQNLNKTLIRKIVDLQLNVIELNQKGHPIDIILRELALYEFQVNNKSLALRYIKKSAKVFDLGDSNIAKWLKALIEIHSDFINGKINKSKNYFHGIKNNEFVEFVKSSNNISLLEKVRYYSPY